MIDERNFVIDQVDCVNPVHSISITDVSGRKRSLQICIGDATDTTRSGPVDILAISCFPDDSLPLPRTIVGQLKVQGINVADLAQNKAVDDRARWQTWISHSLGFGASFGRIACFEHGFDHKPSAVVGNLFRALTGFALARGNRELGIVRLPLLATGDQQADKGEMLDAMVRQAYNQLRLSLPVQTVQIVIYQGWPNATELAIRAALTARQVQDEWAAMNLSSDPEFDFFLSYRRADRGLAQKLLGGLRVRQPGLNIFLDEEALPCGVFWKPRLVGSIYNSSRFLCLITDSYADSGECIDEFHAALSCGRHRSNFLCPLQALSHRTVEGLPPAIRSLNLIDARCPPRHLDDILDAVLAP